MKESELQRVYIFIYPIYPKDSKINRDRVLVEIDSGSPGGSHWTLFVAIKLVNQTTLTPLEKLQTNFS